MFSFSKIVETTVNDEVNSEITKAQDKIDARYQEAPRKSTTLSMELESNLRELKAKKDQIETEIVSLRAKKDRIEKIIGSTEFVLVFGKLERKLFRI